MKTLTTFRGIVRNGKVEPAQPFALPDGSEVYVVVPTGMTYAAAKRKANAWLLNEVGNLLLADKGELARSDDRWIWRFGIYITAPSHEPQGPVAKVDVDASTGAILEPDQTKAVL